MVEIKQLHKRDRKNKGRNCFWNTRMRIKFYRFVWKKCLIPKPYDNVVQHMNHKRCFLFSNTMAQLWPHLSLKRDIKSIYCIHFKYRYIENTEKLIFFSLLKFELKFVQTYWSIAAYNLKDLKAQNLTFSYTQISDLSNVQVFNEPVFRQILKIYFYYCVRTTNTWTKRDFSDTREVKFTRM